MQVSLKIVLAIVTLLGIFLALVRISDLASASAFLFFVAWLLSPLLVTFGVLYFRIAGSPLRRRSARRTRNRTSD